MSPAPVSAAAAGGGVVPDTVAQKARAHVNANSDVFVRRLGAFAAIPSCSADLSRRASCRAAARLVRRWVTSLGGVCEEVNVGYQEVADGTRFDLPPVLLASFGAGDAGAAVAEKEAVAKGKGAKERPTVCVYANYDLRQVVKGTGVDSMPKPPRFATFVHEKADGEGKEPAKTKSAEVLKEANGTAGKEKVAADEGEVEELPFWMSRDGVLQGFGLASGKASLMSWLWTVETYKKLDIPFPVNLKLVIEGMSASSSECLSDLVSREAVAGGFLADVDYVVSTAGTFPAPKTPSVVYATRGMLSVDIQVAGGAKTLSSGEFGGVVAEPMIDLVHLLADISKDREDGSIGVKGCGRDAVPDLSSKEEDLVDAVDSSRGTISALQSAAGNVPAFTEKGSMIQVARTHLPALSIHGIEGAYSGPGVQPTIAPVVSGKVSVRLGRGQSVAGVGASVTEALNSKFKSLKSPNELTVMRDGFEPWEIDPKSRLVEATSAAVAKALRKKPVLARSGHTVSALGFLQKSVGAPAVVVPLFGPVPAYPNSESFSQDQEPVSRDDYLNSIVVLSTLVAEIGALFDDLGGEETASKRRVEQKSSRGVSALSRIKEIWDGLA